MDYSRILTENQVRLPAAFVDLNAFDANLNALASLCKGTDLTIRVATKSIRVPQLIQRALDYGAPYKGLMCFAAEEAAHLAALGFDDILVAYPTLQACDLEALRKVHQRGGNVSLVVDDLEQAEALANSMEGLEHPFRFIVEYDTSLRLLGAVIGVRRSPIRSVAAAVQLIQDIEKKWPQLAFGGFMAYEAQVAGLGDRNPFKKWMNPIFHLVRRLSNRTIRKRREELLTACAASGIRVSLFNGGGTGSLSYNVDEANVLTELTAGSGFYCPHLFDYYSNLQLKPAAFFALQAVRRPDADWITCLGGGYIASGEPGWDRVPRPADAEQKLSPVEGCGEVQTPVHSKGQIALGAPVIFRHAKAGELVERFQDVILLKDGRIVGRAPSYRGQGQCYF